MKAFYLLIYFFVFIGYDSLAQSLPNIVLFISDDISKTDISLYNEKGIPVPNLEELASSGVTFNNAFVASPSCAPSRAALLSGLMPARNGAEANHSFPHQNTIRLTQILQDNGYKVIAFGKVGHSTSPKKASYYNYDYFRGKPVNLAEQVKQYFKENYSAEQPTCLLIGDRRPHVPWIKETAFSIDEAQLPPYFIDTKETREHWTRFASDIKGLDAEVGEVFNFVTDKWKDNFIFIFTGDHGSQWPFGKWNLYDKGINVPLIISWKNYIKPHSHTNAMVSWVDIFPTLIDMVRVNTPDTLDGQSFKPVLMGKSKTHRDKIFTTHSGDGKFNVYPMRSIRSKRYKYIWNLLPEHYHTNHSDLLRKDGAGGYWDSWEAVAQNDNNAGTIIKKYHIRPAEEFYDLEKDPLEQHNLAKMEKHQKRMQKMKQELLTWMEIQGDSQKVFNTPYPISKGKAQFKDFKNRVNKKD